MTAILITPKDPVEFNLIQEVLKKMKISSKIIDDSKNSVYDKIPNAETIKAIQEVKDGKAKEITLAQFRKQLY